MMVVMMTFMLWGVLNEWMRHLRADQQTFLISTKYMQKIGSWKSKVKKKRWEDLMCFFAKFRFANKVLFIETLPWYSCWDVSPSHWPWFHCGLTFNLLTSLRWLWGEEKCNETNKKTSAALPKQSDVAAAELSFSIPGSSFTVVAMVQWKCGLCVTLYSLCFYQED